MSKSTDSKQSFIPKHIAFIPDGNRRWAKARGLATFEGHRRGFESIHTLGKVIRKLGIQTFTIWAFSTENWQRSREEVRYLMKIYEEWIERNFQEAIKDEVRIIHIGRTDRIPKSLREKLAHVQQETKKFDKYYLAIALDYGGRDEIVRAVRKARSSTLSISKHAPEAQNFTEEAFEKFLDTKDLPQPAPDLVIRTSGEQRTSGFLLWQSAYTEYIFHHKYLPEFTPKDFKDCIEEYQKRQRRFGK